MEGRQGTVELFAWKPEDGNRNWSHTISEEDPSILFVKQILVTAGRDFSLPKPSRRKRRRRGDTANPDAMQVRFSPKPTSEWKQTSALKGQAGSELSMRAQ